MAALVDLVSISLSNAASAARGTDNVGPATSVPCVPQVLRVRPSGSLDTRPRGLSHATPLEGCYMSGHDPSPAYARGRVTPDRRFPPQVSWLRGWGRTADGCPSPPE